MLGRLSLRFKLLLLSCVAVGAIAVVAVIGILGIKSGVDGVSDIGRERLPSVIALQALREAQVGLKSSTYEVALWENDTEAQDQFDAIAKDKKRWWEKVEPAWRAYESIPKSAEETKLWGDFVKEWEAWKKVDHAIIAVIGDLAANKDAAKQPTLYQKYFGLGGQQRQHYVAAEKLLGQVIELNARHVAEETDRAVNATRFAQRAMLIGGAVAVVVLAGLALAIIASILGQMGGDPSAAVAVMNRIADGDLTETVPVAAGDDRSMLAAVANMQRRLRSLIGHLRETSERLAESSRSLARDVAHVTEAGKAEAEAATATAGAVDEITRGIGDIGVAADTAKGLSSQAGELSRQGEAAIDAAAREMERIAESVNDSAALIQKLGDYSNGISAIVNVIREISDQTNLLALNAAIEAARAGEQGRGFAVVADEVRKLAERTGQSTHEISTMIESIQSGVAEAVTSMQSGRARVEEGVRMVHDATATMARIQDGSSEANGAVGSITELLHESNRNLTGIAERMGHIVAMVDGTAVSVQAMARSADGLASLAAELTRSAAQFKI